MKHKLFKHEGECPKPGHCRFCDGGLALCTVCGGAEASLPTECPGKRMTLAREAQVAAGQWDFRKGLWVSKWLVENRKDILKAHGIDLDEPEGEDDAGSRP